MILAGDIGGTKTVLGIYNFALRRPVAVDVKTYSTLEFKGLPAIIEAFFTARRKPRIEVACFGVAGPVLDQTAQMTNVPWRVSADEVGNRFNLQRVRLLNDLEAMAYAVPLLDHDELSTLQKGQRRPAGNVALIAAGTGLGESMLHNMGGKLRPLASEGGHTDFAARTDRELDFVRALTRELGRVDLEAVVSGPGLVRLARFTHNGTACGAVGELTIEGNAPAAVSRAALDGRCPRCSEALGMFVSAYGAAAGNLALRVVATGGVYLGGGIAPRILPALGSGVFIEAFTAKAPMTPLLASMPVHVVLHEQAGLLGAAVFANEMV